MLRLAVLVTWLLLSAWLLIWVGEGLFGRDQRRSVLPFVGEDTVAAPLLIGVAWGLLLMVGGVMVGSRGRRPRPGAGRIAIGRIVEIARTGTPANSAAEYEVFVRVSPKDGDDFIAQVRGLVEPTETLQTDLPVAVRYRPGEEDTVALADPRDPAAVDALREWGVERRQIDRRDEGVAE